MIRLSLVFSLCLSYALTVSAQDTIQFNIPEDRNLVDYSNNVIHNPNGLNPFFYKLLKLKLDGKSQINIIHIGDSHIQADYLTNQVRQNLQREFGNGGRGFLIPARVAQTNEPNNYTSQSPNTWEAKRIVFPDQPLPTGIGGVTIRTPEETSEITFNVKNYPDLRYGFDKVTTYFLQEPRSYTIVITDSTRKSLAYIGSFNNSTIRHSASVTLPYSTNNITFKTFKSLPEQDRVTYFGFNFQNSNPGIIYHAIGANGAKFKHYLSDNYFIDQVPSLRPDLIIVALGTNEALDHPYFDPRFPEYLDEFIQKLRSNNPGAIVMLSILPGSFKRKNKSNPGVTNIRKHLIDYANAFDLPYYDLYASGGGDQFAGNWRKVELLREDGVHFTRQGYELQGNMLYDAMMNAYNNYVSNRH